MASSDFEQNTTINSLPIKDLINSDVFDVNEKVDYTSSPSPERGQVVPGSKDKGSVWLLYSPKEQSITEVDINTGKFTNGQ
jgi:hypothetical protein